MASDIIHIRKVLDELSSKSTMQLKKEMENNTKLRKEINDWCKEHGYKNNIIEIISIQSSYNLILKLLLYEILKEPYAFPNIIGKSFNNIMNSFETAYKKTELLAFKSSLLDKILLKLDGDIMLLLSDLLEELEDIQNSRHDIFGKLYEQIMPGEERRRLGQFYTPRYISEFMAKWAIDSPNNTILDPAVGSGMFLIESYYTMMDLGSDHSEILDHLYGIDINNLAIIMSTLNLVSRNQNKLPHLFLKDFFKTSLKKKFDVILCNPPYTRHHEFSSDYKEFIANKIEKEFNIKISKLSSFYLHFFIYANKFIKKNGKIAFITPSEFLDVQYGVILKKFLLDNYSIDAIILANEDELVFNNVMTTACITLLKNKKIKNNTTKFIKINFWPSQKELINLLNNGETSSSDWYDMQIHNQDELDPKLKWNQLFDKQIIKSRFKTVLLGDIAKTKRGIATGANSYFTLTNAEVKDWKIEDKFLKPVITTSKNILYLDYTLVDREELKRMGKSIWLLYCNQPESSLMNNNIYEYLQYGKRIGITEKYLTKNRSIWYVLDKRTPATILFTYMSRKNPRFIYNKTNSLNLNNLHMIYPIKEIENNIKMLKTILLYLNSTYSKNNLRKVGRLYGDGLLKIEPKELLQLPCIDPRSLSEYQLDILSTEYDKLCHLIRQNQDVSNNIDQILNEVL